MKRTGTPVQLSPRQRAAVHRSAMFAVERGAEPTACPFTGDGAVPEAMRAAWMRLYLEHRPPAPGTVTYDDPK